MVGTWNWSLFQHSTEGKDEACARWRFLMLEYSYRSLASKREIGVAN